MYKGLQEQWKMTQVNVLESGACANPFTQFLIFTALCAQQTKSGFCKERYKGKAPD